MTNFLRANQALYDGNRGEITSVVPAAATSGRELWLLAAAADDEAERLDLLARVDATGELPYARMAREILVRERWFAEEIARPPSWQLRLKAIGRVVLRALIAVPFVIVVVWLGQMFVSPRAAAPPATTVGNVATNNAGAVAPTAYPSPVFTPSANQPIANYMPTGALRVLNVAFPAPEPPAPSGFVSLLLAYEFTCGNAAATCDQPPNAVLAIELADSTAALVQEAGRVPWHAEAAPLDAGDSARQWAWFLVPANQSPRRLVVLTGSQQDGRLDVAARAELTR